MQTNKARYVILIIATILLLIQLYIADYSNFWSFETILPLISPALLILAMLLSINHVNKHVKNKN